LTAEIALLNKLAVTLAADSAVTIPSSDGIKVYNSADKIFEGTIHDPIGVMVYNSPEINGVPVESIVKMYRDQKCIEHYATVFDYALAFLKYLEELDTPDITVNNNIQDLIADRLFALRADLRLFSDEFFRHGSADEQHATVEEALSALDTKIDEVLDSDIASLEAAPDQEWAGGLSAEDVISYHGEAIENTIDAIFRDEFLPTSHRNRIVSIAAWSLLKEFQRSKLTGMVFAGFGKDEIFPSLVGYEVYGIVSGKLKYIETNRFDVDRKLTPDAAVLPFAQKEMVDRFMYGLDSEFLTLCNTYFSGAHEALKRNLDELLLDAGDEVRNAVAPAIDTILEEFRGQIVPGHLQRLRQQFSDMVRSMPKQELAALSESLVHITSLKRKFSAGAESVGGPIDVAMITRAEGFVWVKRKHYFDPELNPRYFFRRYGKGIESDRRLDSAPDEAK
jgi:hypothetical protein